MENNLRKIILGALLMLSSNVFASVSFQEAQIIFKQLETKAGINVPLVLVKTNEVNAATDGYKIKINTGMLRFLDNKEQLALVLGHEIGHIKTNGWGKRWEFTADAYGAALASSVGYSACKGREFFRKMVKRFGNYPSTSHPKNGDRYNKLAVFCTGGFND